MHGSLARIAAGRGIAESSERWKVPEMCTSAHRCFLTRPAVTSLLNPVGEQKLKAPTPRSRLFSREELDAN